jgi:O-antigen ligase
MWRLAWNGFCESPLLGKGYGWRIPITIGGPITEETPASNIHNSYLHTLACGGLLGFGTLLAVVLRFFYVAGRQIQASTTRVKRIWTGAACSIGLNFFCTALTNVTFESVLSGITGWVLVALALRVALASEEEILQAVPYHLRNR